MAKKKGRYITHAIRICCLTGALFAYSASALAILPNTALPQGGQFIPGLAGNTGSITSSGNVMNVTQNGMNAVIKWDDFSIGANATVNFNGQSGFNVLNYVDSGKLSQIYGTMNAKDGNVFLVNTAGTLIGKSAQINVGSLYVSNKKMENADLNAFFKGGAKPAINGTVNNAELMSLGHINAEKITFDGDRIVLDTDRLNNTKGGEFAAQNLVVKTKNADNVVLGYTAYENGTYDNAKAHKKFKLNDGTETEVEGYMWINDVEQLQAMNTNLDGRYALHNSIDATNTAQKGFTSIGSIGNAFTGKLDGLASGADGNGHSIFGLTITGTDNVGLFGVAENASIKNLIMTSGSVDGKNNVGGIVGSATNTVVHNVASTMNVNGKQNVGGLVGFGANLDADTIYNSGHIKGHENVGGLIGQLQGGKLTGNSVNIGQIMGQRYESELYTEQKPSHNIGGLVGSATNAQLGSADGKLENKLTVTGGYNIGGIVGKAENTSITNAQNSANIVAREFIKEQYKYHNEKNNYKYVEVQVANAGGIAGNVSGNSKITNVVNNGGNVSSVIERKGEEVYIAGNVGGIVGRAEGTEAGRVVIENALNKENVVRGAHNVGGIVGYVSKGNVKLSVNNGGDIMGTGAKNEGRYVYEDVRDNPHNEPTINERYHIGNIGGVAGYMDGDEVYLSQVGNRGNVHSQYIKKGEAASESAMAANVGGVAGKVDRNKTITLEQMKDTNDGIEAAITDAYNTGKVQGFTGVAGIAGFMYNGEVANSYNLGSISSTRYKATGIQPLNMGGIVGDTTEKTSARALIYNVYNSGKIGDENYEYYGRHVGGVVGRLSGRIEQSYNTGAVYNGYNVVGGVVGWMYAGTVHNSFNTGNVTVVNNDSKLTSQVGGIAGAVDLASGKIEISNAYNLGTIRTFQVHYDMPNNSNPNTTSANHNALGGIIGEVWNYTPDNAYRPGELVVKNVYTLGKLYAGIINKQNGSCSQDTRIYIQPIIGGRTTHIGGLPNKFNNKITVENAYYILPSEAQERFFGDLHKRNDDIHKGHYTTIAYADRSKSELYKFDFTTQVDGNVQLEDGKILEETWRAYEGSTTPILNAFLPNSEGFFGQEQNYDKTSINSIQYGTAYNPLLTIIDAKKDLVYDWGDLHSSGGASYAVYGAGLTLNNCYVDGNYFGGTIYSDGALNINGKEGHDISIGSGGKLYGSSVSINADKDNAVHVYGTVTATGNGSKGDIDITAGSVEVIGSLNSSKAGEKVVVSGVGGLYDDSALSYENVHNHKVAMPTVETQYSNTTEAAAADGNVNLTAVNGDVHVLNGVSGLGKLTAYGDLNIKSADKVYIDSDLSLGKNLNISAPGEIILDLSHIGRVGAKDDAEANGKLNSFMQHFGKGTGNSINMDNGSANKANSKAKITLDLWNGNSFASDKFGDGAVLLDELQKLNIKNGSKSVQGDKIAYLWISNAEQLNNIAKYAMTSEGKVFLDYQFALKNDIDANNIIDYVPIGSNASFKGHFDGRGNSIVGLNVKATDGFAGIFGIIGKSGVVDNLNVISSSFTGGAVGVIAGVNNGRIEGIGTFGNKVTSVGHATNSGGQGHPGDKVGAAGGAVGVNFGTINDVHIKDVVIADSTHDTASGPIDSSAGGVAGLNTGSITNSSSNSAVTSSDDDAKALGGIVGINIGKVQTVDSFGVVNGSFNSGNKIYLTSNVGGVVGANYFGGQILDAYNEAYVFGSKNVGGIVGYTGNAGVTGDQKPTNKISNAVNSGIVIGSGADAENTGGLVGNSHCTEVSDARNTGIITGNKNVGGIVGSNAICSTMTDIVNDGSATITGKEFVGGIAGNNEGKINATTSNLVNNGKIYGNKYVGGIAGKNTGIIQNTVTDITLHAYGENSQYFGGVVGLNADKGSIINATNSGEVVVEDASYVGGVAGKNEGVLAGAGNTGTVTGKNHVGGVAGVNSGKLANGVVIRNEGVVTATNGGAGGIFAVNGIQGQGNHYENVTLINTGVVKGIGDSGTGGIFGINYDSFSKSSIMNTAKSQVSGDSNVGGLIGINYGDIIGGRENADGSDAGKYINQIYNNGVIDATGDNVGGLFGVNYGKVEAAYNTGAVIGQNNIGGIAGVNHGSIDQAFNTVMAAPGSIGSINGKSNVGGLIGYNDGSLSNAYNTTLVAGAVNTGNIIGSNVAVADKAGSGNVSNIFDVENSGKLIGDNTGKVNGSFSLNSAADEGLAAEHVQITKDNKLDKGAYGVLVSEKDANGKDVWRFYDGHRTPILKVFLTNAQYTGNVDLTYNGKEQGLTVNGTTVDAKDGLGAFNNNNALLEALLHKNSGKDYVGLVSQQIAASGENADSFNPNNLGYDIDVKFNINKATLNVTLDDITRIYGDLFGVENLNKNPGKGHNTIGKGGYGYTVSADNMTDEMLAELFGKGGMTHSAVKDGAVKDEAKGYTQNVGSYDLSADFHLGELANNYQFADGKETMTAISKGGSTVTKAKLTINVGNVNTSYGTAFKEQDYGYEFGAGAGLVNGDGKDVLGNIKYNNQAALDGTNGKVTADAGDYKGVVTITDLNDLTNYDVTVNNGDAHVDKANLSITGNNVTIYKPDNGVKPSYTGSISGLVNGDEGYKGSFGITDSKLQDELGVHKGVIGIVIDGVLYTQNGGAWEKQGFWKNYNISINPGTLAVKDGVPGFKPDKPVVPGNNPFWEAEDKYAWGKKREERERKAEVHFVDGGQVIADEK